MLKKTMSLFLCLALLLGSLGVLAQEASGVFTGEGQGYSKDKKIVVDVTLEGGKITKIEVKDHGEAANLIPWVKQALAELPAKMVEKNTAEVAAVSGASWTSRGLVLAVQDALAKAAGQPAAEAPAAEAPAAEAPASSASGQFEGEGEGYSTETKIKVQVTLEGGKITAIEVKDHGESADIIPAVAAALTELPAKMVEQNSAEVEAATGASWTSKGLKAAVKDALAKAGTQPEAPAAQAPAAEAPAAAVSGQFEGEGEGYSTETKIKVQVTLEGGKITAIEVKDHGESADVIPAVAAALTELPAKMVEQNSAEVEAATGASWTSKGLKAAVKDALAKAGAQPEAPAAQAPAAEAPAAAVSGQFEGEGEGYSTETKIKVQVTMENGKITAIEVKDHGESADIIPAVAAALTELPAKMVEQNSAEVEAATGASWTSKGLMAAVKDALSKAEQAQPAAQPAPVEPVVVSGKGLTLGLGIHNSGRIGPGKDDKDVQVYSINQVFAGVIFDEQGKIVYAKLDQLEVATPNYDGAGMPHFAGFPGQLPYLYDENHDGKIDGVLETSDEHFQAEISGWQTKRERGSAYKMNLGTWSDQMNAYEAFFVGKTVEELEALFARLFSDRNGRPLKDGSSNEADKAKYDALSDEDKALLADVVTSATMSLNDSHGNLLAALRMAYETRQPVKASAASLGLGFDFSGRIGPGKDNTETQVYSINQVVALNLFDADGKIVQSLVDQIEVATPNYDGPGMPHFSGFPGQGGYNYDSDHDEKVDGRLVTNSDGFQAEISAWQSKRQRGDAYKMNLATWSAEMDAYQAFFAGKTLDELDALFARLFSDRNGRPLKDGSSNEADKAKYDALSAEDKALLADVVTGATMSLNDSHGSILGALRDSLDKKLPVEITLE